MSSRILFAVVAALSLVPGAGHSQSLETGALRLDDFRLSGPPALGLLGSSVAAVARPNTPRDLIASLVSGAGSEGIVPDGFALETAPFWLARHRGMTLDDYYRASLPQRALQFAAISVATSRKRSRSEEDGYESEGAIAIRTLLANGRPSAALPAVTEELRMKQQEYIEAFRAWEAAAPRAVRVAARKRQLAQLEDLVSSLTTRVLVTPAPSLRDSTLRTLARRDSLRALVTTGEEAAADTAELNRRMERIETEMSKLGERFAAAESEPDGFILEIAGGARAKFPDGRWADERVDGYAAWITPMYRIGSRGLELIGVARIITSMEDYGGHSVADFGGRAGIGAGKGNFSAEHVWRSLHGNVEDGPQIDSRNSTRWAVLFDYPLSDRLWISASFGSDYRRAGERPLIATIGVNLGAGAIEILGSRRREARSR
jgi:hypothetical protein